MTVAQATEVPGGLDYLAARGHLTRLAVEAALALIGMWQADPKATAARHGVTDADDALEQVRRILLATPPPAKATNHDGYHRGGRRPGLPGPREGEAR